MSAATRVATELAHDILREMPPGTTLPSESELATRFEVSRLTIRESMKILSGRGLVDAGRGRRAVTRRPDGSAFSDYLASVILTDPRGLFDLMELRLALETQTASLAARRISRAALGKLESYVAGMRAVAKNRAADGSMDEETFNRNDVAFHEAIATASGNCVLTALFEALAPPLFESFARSLQGQRRRGNSVDVTIAAHAAVLDAIAARQPEEAANAMRRHLEETALDINVGIGAPNVRTE